MRLLVLVICTLSVGMCIMGYVVLTAHNIIHASDEFHKISLCFLVGGLAILLTCAAMEDYPSCPFTGDVAKGVRSIGDGITVYPQMKLVACDQIVMHARTVRDSLELGIAQSAIKGGSISYNVNRLRNSTLSIVCIRFSCPCGHWLTVYLDPLSNRGLLITHRLRVAQRCVRLWLRRMEHKRRIEVLQEGLLCEHSPLSVLPIDLFMAKIALHAA